MSCRSCAVILRGQLLAQSAKVAYADCQYFVWTSVRLRSAFYMESRLDVGLCYYIKSCSEQKTWELNCMLSKTRPEAKVRGRAKKDAGARLGVEGLRSIRRGAY